MVIEPTRVKNEYEMWDIIQKRRDPIIHIYVGVDEPDKPAFRNVAWVTMDREGKCFHHYEFFYIEDLKSTEYNIIKVDSNKELDEYLANNYEDFRIMNESKLFRYLEERTVIKQIDLLVNDDKNREENKAKYYDFVKYDKVTLYFDITSFTS